MRRARIVFNRSVRGECNKRAFEAAAAGALLFQEAENREVREYFGETNHRGAESTEARSSTEQDCGECVLYDEGSLEELLEYYLAHEDERKAIAEAGRRRVAEYSFEKLWQKEVQKIEVEWEAIVQRA